MENENAAAEKEIVVKPRKRDLTRKIVVAEEQAQEELDFFLFEMDIDSDTENMDDEDDVKGFKKAIGRLKRAIMHGYATINDSGEFVYTTQKSAQQLIITFHERSGRDVLAMDGNKKNQDVKKMHAVMAKMCKIEQKDFALMKGSDIKTCEAAFVLLMD